MTGRSVHVVRPGMQTTVQDLGRWGFQAQGVPVAGPMDPFSHRCANALVGNPASAATLEVTMIGPELEFEHECMVAVAGAVFAVTIDGAPFPHAQVFMAGANSRMAFGSRLNGTRAYLAVAGGFDVPSVLGSRATHVPSALGGWNGRALLTGDRLPIGEPARHRPAKTRMPAAPQTAGGLSVVRALAGPDTGRFGSDALEALQSAPYVVEADSDRMGFRLRGPQIFHLGSADIISDVTPMGTVQVPGSGQPILLMADRQTSGGYPRIATVITADLGIAGQQAPGDPIHFRLCTRAEAFSALIARERVVLALEAAWA